MKRLFRARAEMQMYGVLTPHASGPNEARHARAEKQVKAATVQLDWLLEKLVTLKCKAILAGVLARAAIDDNNNNNNNQANDSPVSAVESPSSPSSPKNGGKTPTDLESGQTAVDSLHLDALAAVVGFE